MMARYGSGQDGQARLGEATPTSDWAEAALQLIAEKARGR